MVEVCVKPIRPAIIALAFGASWPLFNLWAQESEAELLKQARVTKHQAKRIALAKVKHGTIKRVDLEMANGVLIWSVDLAQPGEKDLRDVWIDATTGKITVTVGTGQRQSGGYLWYFRNKLRFPFMHFSPP